MGTPGELRVEVSGPGIVMSSITEEERSCTPFKIQSAQSSELSLIPAEDKVYRERQNFKKLEQTTLGKLYAEPGIVHIISIMAGMKTSQTSWHVALADLTEKW
ncbi:hypothetical protein llap_13872 [Limosa lapponica baueri]|uniref:Uncharacterized protein n=1 Tax=Limosa lapponica baueri TaxID=1758121 RepID=A0A2I0TQ22_LIMLA|nr:hypothetical protein llap_13872 [Limosa lapponica baueri]